MDATDHDLLFKLPPELRLDIYMRVLTSHVPLQRPRCEDDSRVQQRARLSLYQDTPKEEQVQAQTRLTCTPLMMLAGFQTSPPWLLEAVDILYRENTFELALDEVAEFESSSNFCSIKQLRLHNPEENVLAWLLPDDFAECAKDHATRTMNGTLALERVVILAPELDSHSLRYLTAVDGYQSVDIGVWSIGHREPYAFQLEDPVLRQSWAKIRELGVPKNKRSLSEMIAHYKSQILSAQSFTYSSTYREDIPHGSRLEVLALHAMAVDGVCGDGLVGDHWRAFFRAARSLRRNRGAGGLGNLRITTATVDDLVKYKDGYKGGKTRLIDVNAECSRDVLAWANDVLIDLRARVCRSAW
ncbi:hypothetical protein LTR10_002545 [Elasticomyces elasticus]|nr:hypothetical protein LTR10_002545 [Elasticomyces elasticus]KAK4973400.1 hypothetical protein LTR42_005385 [Elasticomyces elasticus]